MKLKGIINIDSGEDDKDVGLEKSYTQLKHNKGEKKPYLHQYNPALRSQQDWACQKVK